MQRRVPLPLLPVCLFGVLLAMSPAQAQEAPPPAQIAFTNEQVRSGVKVFRQVFADISRKQSSATAISRFYASDYTFVGFDGKTTTRDELISGTGRFHVTTVEQNKEDLKAEGGKAHELAEKDRQWKPEKYEVSGNEVAVYSYPVSKNTQPIPDSDGRAKNAEIKTLMTVKETFVAVGEPLSGGVPSLRLKRVEILGAKMYINGKVQPASVLKNGEMPVL